MFNWTTFLALILVLVFLSFCNAEPISKAELERIFRSNPTALARFQEMFGGDGMGIDSGRLSNLQRLG
ncbi:unnamed protein product [Cylicocyclus nassatus]|uniref:Uncharacterized protein n=1 Tax=Cylicocyclus nassatus TaxID=53992 RepID=A0AA36HAM8_CYLNA|nr:unnamed protein product [Cylicocyclus nassatus]